MSITQQSNIDFIPEDWGWKQECFASWAAMIAENTQTRELVPARVTGREHHLYEIVCPDFRSYPLFEKKTSLIGQFDNVRVSGRFEHGTGGTADFPVTGDWVLVDGDAGTPRIQGVLNRRSALSRASAGNVGDEQVLASNIDVIFLVFALDGGRNFLLRFLERALIVAKNSGAACCIVLNKADLATGEERERAIADAHRAAPNVSAVALSAKTGEGIEELSGILSPGDTGCMLGKSGVGKSALLNALGKSTASVLNEANSANATPNSDATLAREGNVRENDLRGRHTTTSSHLYRLKSGIFLIDSPGIRELKLWGDAEGLESGFPEIAELASRCRFSNCAHKSENGCAVREALASGKLDEQRYRSYLDLAREQAWIERRNDDRARRENEQKWKNISKLQKEIKKTRR